MRLRWNRLLLTLGLQHLLRLTARLRRVLRHLPMVGTDSQETLGIPRELTGVRVPLRLRPETETHLRQLLEDLVILLEMLAQRMRTLSSMISTSLRSR
jgi:hypothetical protein